MTSALLTNMFLVYSINTFIVFIEYLVRILLFVLIFTFNFNILHKFNIANYSSKVTPKAIILGTIKMHLFKIFKVSN